MRHFDTLTPSRVAFAFVAAGAIALTACTSNNATPASSSAAPTALPTELLSPAMPSESASSAPAPLPTGSITPSADLSAITVSDADTPEITVPFPWAIASTQTKVLRESGNTQVVGEDASVTVNYVGVNGRTGKVFDSSFQNGQPATFQLGAVVPGFKKGLAGQKVGSRVLIGMTGEDGYAQGNPQAGIEVGDTLLFTVDIISASFAEPMGEEVAPAEGLPTVAVTDGKPQVTIPEGLAVDKLVTQPLIKGPGTAIAEDSTITARFVGYGAKSGKLVLDGWSPQTQAVKALLEGWKVGLVGQTSGSRVLLVIPGAQAYPTGLPDRGLEAGEAMVFVIDILDVTATQ